MESAFHKPSRVVSEIYSGKISGHDALGPIAVDDALEVVVAGLVLGQVEVEMGVDDESRSGHWAALSATQRGMYDALLYRRPIFETEDT